MIRSSDTCTRAKRRGGSGHVSEAPRRPAQAERPAPRAARPVALSTARRDFNPLIMGRGDCSRCSRGGNAVIRSGQTRKGGRMAGIKAGRVIGGGLVAGLVMNVI